MLLIALAAPIVALPLMHLLQRLEVWMARPQPPSAKPALDTGMPATGTEAPG